ncbi:MULTISPECIES: hypothetical protein [Vibrio]|uniref:Lipoprotein n=1 Tax=Vibrio bivalvicida TaxID=1276888 RepID=A0A177Y3Y5_9VIBR|nr:MULTISPECIES: hypothetical protein [Vibrio]KLN63252.1 hypothetical protein ZX61_23320 [Vibrio sp. VPAP30]OAJ95594.1 hypothetical protein APB76_03565 [Vibrio bivalvicida]
MRNVNLNSIWQSVGLSMLLVLSGCAENVSMREGQAIHTVPMTYTWSASFEPAGIDKAKQEVQKLIDHNWQIVASKGINLQWSTRLGKQFVISIRQGLLERGVESNQISLHQEQLDSGKDVAVEFHYTKVITELCTPSKVGKFGTNAEGCFAENARWQSMVNPENTLSSQPLAK